MVVKKLEQRHQFKTKKLMFDYDLKESVEEFLSEDFSLEQIVAILRVKETVTYEHLSIYLD